MALLPTLPMEYEFEKPELGYSMMALLNLKRILYQAVWQNIGFAAPLPCESGKSTVRVHGDPKECVMNALAEFRERYAIDDDVWEWMIENLHDLFADEEEWAQKNVEDDQSSLEWVKWVRCKFDCIRLGWLLGHDEMLYRNFVAKSLVHREAARLIKIVLHEVQPDEEGDDAVSVL